MRYLENPTTKLLSALLIFFFFGFSYFKTLISNAQLDILNTLKFIGLAILEGFKNSLLKFYPTVTYLIENYSITIDFLKNVAIVIIIFIPFLFLVSIALKAFLRERPSTPLLLFITLAVVIILSLIVNSTGGEDIDFKSFFSTNKNKQTEYYSDNETIIPDDTTENISTIQIDMS